jgi:hypothetical protein
LNQSRKSARKSLIPKRAEQRCKRRNPYTLVMRDNGMWDEEGDPEIYQSVGVGKSQAPHGSGRIANV